MQLPVSYIEKGFLSMGLARERAWPDKRVLDLTACTQPSPKHWHKEGMRVLVPEWQQGTEAGPNVTVSCKQDTGHWTLPPPELGKMHTLLQQKCKPFYFLLQGTSTLQSFSD